MRVLILGCAIIAGCGISPELYTARTAELDRCQSEQARLQSDANGARSHIDDLVAQANRLRERVTTLEGERTKLASNLKATEHEMDELRRQHAQSEQRSELWANLTARLRSLIDAQLLSVEVRKGKLLVRLSEQPLFEPGQAELKSSGQAVLRQVATALRETPDRDFLVIGHTDNLPVKSSLYRSNWDLSTARAVAAVRFFQAEGIDPRHLIAAGSSEFDGVGENTTAEERALNRRLEVVVMPTADELPTIHPAAPSLPANAPKTDS